VRPAYRVLSHVPRSWFLADAIAARYAVLQRRWPVLALVYPRRDEPSVFISQPQPAARSSILVNPRLLLSMLVTHRQEVRQFGQESSPARLIGRHVVARTLAVPRKAEQVAQTQREVIERILRRTLREERVGGATGLPADWSLRTVPPVTRSRDLAAPTPSMRMVYPGNPRTREERPATAEGVQAELHRSPAAAVRHAEALVHSQAEITRITDHVLHALDRRIVAQRERMGRV
jgi:hypothetical protein